MAQAWTGLLVQVTAESSTNNGRNKAPAVITSVNGDGPNGGILVNLVAFPDAGVAPVYGAEDVELFDYEDDARDLDPGEGAWPMDG